MNIGGVVLGPGFVLIVAGVVILSQLVPQLVFLVLGRNDATVIAVVCSFFANLGWVYLGNALVYRHDGLWWFRRKINGAMALMRGRPDGYECVIDMLDYADSNLSTADRRLVIEAAERYYTTSAHAPGCIYRWPACECDCGRSDLGVRLRSLGRAV